MTLAPLLAAPFAVQLHVCAALCAIILGPLALWRRSRDHWHKRFGYAWVVAMALTALSSFAILDRPMIGPFSVIHALSVVTVIGLWKGVNAARARRIEAHQAEMRSLYFWAMGVAGLFTFLPGRRMNMVFFAGQPWLGFAVMTILIGSGLLWYWIAQRQRQNQR